MADDTPPVEPPVDPLRHPLQGKLEAIIRRKFGVRQQSSMTIASEILTAVKADENAPQIEITLKNARFKPFVPRVEDWQANMGADDWMVTAIEFSARVTRKQARMAVRIIVREIEAALVVGDSYTIENFGTFAARAQALSQVNTNAVGTGVAIRKPFRYFFKQSQLLEFAVN